MPGVRGCKGPVARQLLKLATPLAAAGLIIVTSAEAQDSATVVLGERYARGGGVAGIGGQGWRAAWGTQVRLPLLTSAAVEGGLQEVREQAVMTRVFVGRSRSTARAWRILPVDPDPISPIIPASATASGLPQFLRDLVAALHPAAPQVAAALYRAVGLPVVPRELVVVPTTGVDLVGGVVPAGTAVWTERAPELDGQPFGRFASVISTDSLRALKSALPGTRIDLPGYLAARLTDVVLGDRNRPPEAWLWGWDRERSVWVPIARAQEQALLRAGRGSRLLLGAYQPGFVSFGPHAPHTSALTLRAWDLDRPWLAWLERAAWDSVASQLAGRLDDTAIARVVAALPEAYHRQDGEEIAHALRVRRDALPRVVDEFYRRMTWYPDLDLSELADTVSVKRTEDGSLEIRGGGTGPRDARRFTRRETAEVRLHLRGGSDLLRVEDMERSGVGLRVSGGSGQDHVERTGDRARRVVVYDERGDISFTPENAARLVPHPAERQLRWKGNRAPPPPDHGSQHSPAVVVGFNSDLGLFAGSGMRWKWYGFDQPHYRQRLSVTAGYAFKPGRARAAASFERRDILRNIHLSSDVLASGVEVVRYHGLGNGTVDTAASSFYQALHRVFNARLMVGISRNPSFELRVGPVVSLQSTDTTGAEGLVAIEKPYGAGDFNVAGVEATLRFHPERSSFAPGLGLAFQVSGQYYPAVMDAESSFGGLSGEVDASWVPQLASRFIGAARIGGSVLGGKVPFGSAARVGGPRTLRGYSVDRFSGDRGSIYGSLELRARITRFRIGMVPGDFGVLAFGSGGRVWQRGEFESAIHGAFGGGIWVAPTINWLPDLGDLVGRVEVAKGSEGTFVYFGTGFRF